MYSHRQYPLAMAVTGQIFLLYFRVNYMQIGTDVFSDAALRSRKNETSTPVHQTTDVDFFASQLNNPAPPRNITTSPIDMPLLADRSTRQGKLLDGINKGMRDLSLSKNTKETRELTRFLSESHQQLAVSVKIINKCVQLIEKTSNLQ